MPANRLHIIMDALVWTVTTQRDNQPRTSGGRASFQMEETGKLGKRHEGGREKGKRV